MIEEARTNQIQFSWPLKSQATAIEVETQIALKLNNKNNSNLVWFKIAPTPPCLNILGVKKKIPNNRIGVRIPITISAINEPQAGGMEGLWFEYQVVTDNPNAAVAIAEIEVKV